MKKMKIKDEDNDGYDLVQIRSPLYQGISVFSPAATMYFIFAAYAIGLCSDV